MSLDLQHIFDTFLPTPTLPNHVTQIAAPLTTGLLSPRLRTDHYLHSEPRFYQGPALHLSASAAASAAAPSTPDLLTQLYGAPLHLSNSSGVESETTQLTDNVCSSNSSTVTCTSPISKVKRKKTRAGASASKSVAKRGRRISSNSTLPCPVCQQTYSRKDNLRAHMRVHSGEKPYKCKECSSTFRWLGALRKHRANHVCSSASTSCTGSDKDEDVDIGDGDAVLGQALEEGLQPMNPMKFTSCISKENEGTGIAGHGGLLEWEEKSPEDFMYDFSFAETWSSLPELHSTLQYATVAARN